MSLNNYQEHYLKTKVETASPGELTLILYEEFCKKLSMTKALIQKGFLDQVKDQIYKAKDILDELIITLNMQYDIAKQLYELYTYYKGRLNDFLISKEVVILDEVMEFGRGMVDTWKQALQILKTGSHV
ncbi:flagellar export chaperone FliS [Paenibacillus aceris]|uniref:Flagellar secretion chaperone FliS n=1 Tax=Paenibacillus aceris TaxID=869555 RepID=A0ABS4I4F5_9BACL|nr:flagellar export chaperone FliS [Paenibacillus aceris]MBP1965806.1 flagellar protein FliS [Paenibacillus aceris]NHW34848.1 flagellar export chaperone FliS [Paenibacillus aceris]